MVCGHVAQWIEHQVPVLRVGGSNPSVFVKFLGVSFGYSLISHGC